MRNLMTEFRQFILRGNMVDLAVGIVIGAAFTGVVQSLVKGIITPLIGVFGGIPDVSSWVITETMGEALECQSAKSAKTCSR